MQRNFALSLFLILSFVFILNGQPSMTTSPAPEFPDYAHWLNSDRAYTMEEFRGKFVLLDFWTYCCINCMHILPDLKKLEQTYPEELVVIGIHTPKFPGERETDNIRQAILRYEIEHPVVNDHQYTLWKRYGVRAWPTVALIDPEGDILGVRSGEGVWEALNPLLKEKVAEYKKLGKLREGVIQFKDEPVAEGMLSFPGKVLADPFTDRLYISDSNHNRILIVERSTGHILESIGNGEQGKRDGSYQKAQFHHPQGLARQGNYLFVADTENHLIRQINLTNKQVSTLAGTGKQARRFNNSGKGTQVALNSPWDILYYKGLLYVAMAGFHQIWTVNPQTLFTQPFAGSGHENITDGSAQTAALAQPSGLATDGKFLYVADSEVSGIRQINLDTGDVETIVGRGLFEFGDVDGNGKDVRLQHPLGVTWADGRLFVADTYNNKIKVIHPTLKSADTFAGKGEEGSADGIEATFDEPGGLSFAEGKLYVADTNNHLIRVIDTKTGVTTTLPIQSE